MRKPMKQLLKPLFLVLLCVWSLSLHADVFKGIVIDAETRQPLSGVTIKAIQSGQGSDNWTITNDYTSDSLGHFEADVWMEHNGVATHGDTRHLCTHLNLLKHDGCGMKCYCAHINGIRTFHTIAIIHDTSRVITNA